MSPALDPFVGLCSVCCQAQRIVSARGSSFYLCRMASRDETFLRYPRLPVMSCRGFEDLEEA